MRNGETVACLKAASRCSCMSGEHYENLQFRVSCGCGLGRASVEYYSSTDKIQKLMTHSNLVKGLLLATALL
jgi:hypothetical protein